MLTAYYAVLGAAVWGLVKLLPGIPDLLAKFREVSVLSAGNKGQNLSEAGNGFGSFPQSELALITLVSMLAALMLVIPVAYVYMVTKQRRGYDQSVVQTVIVLPMVVAGTLILVQNSISLAFALGAVAIWLVGLIARRLYDVEIAEKAMVLMALFPGSFVLSFVYSLVDEVMHWRRYLSQRSDVVEMWSHVFILIGHGTMMAGWWRWYALGYPGVARTLGALGLAA